MTCGTTLSNVDESTTTPETETSPQTFEYDYRHGETDLFEGDLRRVGQTYMAGVFLFLAGLMCGGLALAFAPSLVSNLTNIPLSGDRAQTTPTPRPTLALPTVTPGSPTMSPTNTSPPTPTVTATPTPEPCYQTVRPLEGLYAVVARCGHLNFDVLGLVVEINGLRDANSIQEGQILEIPWPTETSDPNAVPAEPPTNGSTGQENSQNDTSDEADEDTEDMAEGEEAASRQVSAFDDDFDPLFVPTPTLPPGVMFHIVQSGETIISVGVTYGANVEILSQLNPEITFSQCDYGQTFGGPRCTVSLIEGQRIRVPAPTPTPTIPPTLSGSETPTPSPTATFNAPSLQSPSDRAHFYQNQLITLRWIPTGTLAESQTYRLRVEDVTAGIVYTVDTTNTFYVIPAEWQGEDSDRHEYAWTISVINLNNPDNALFSTGTRTFTWETRG